MIATWIGRTTLRGFADIDVWLGGEASLKNSPRERVMREHRYDALTWQEINEAIALE